MTTEQIKETMCDEYCKYPYELSEEQLADKCESCPLNNLKGGDPNDND